jgi:hypothetical protein
MRKGRANGETIKSFAVITGALNPLGAPFHDRMPVIFVPVDSCGRIWEEPMLRDRRRVGNVMDGEAGLIEPLAAFAVWPRSLDLVIPMHVSNAKLKTYLIGTLTVVGPIAAIALLVALGFR